MARPIPLAGQELPLSARLYAGLDVGGVPVRAEPPADAPSPPATGGPAGSLRNPLEPLAAPHASLGVLQAVAAAVRRNAAVPDAAAEKKADEPPAASPRAPAAPTAPASEDAPPIGEQRIGRDWLVTWLPLMLPEGALPTRWLHRSPDDGGRSGDGRPGTDRRFVAEATFQGFGRVQVDGLVRTTTRTVSLIVRSEQAMREDHRAMIARIFQEGVELAAYTGEISFSPPPALFVEPAAPAGAGSTLGLIV